MRRYSIAPNTKAHTCVCTHLYFIRISKVLPEVQTVTSFSVKTFTRRKLKEVLKRKIIIKNKLKKLIKHSQKLIKS